MKPLDWIVVALYFSAMLGIGAYYALRNRSREDYLLGGRTMGATSVGLSLFATLFSTNSYLAFPADTIINGPITSAMILAYPLVYFIVGYGIIPQFMRLRVTSAYEILEKRFGVGVRMLGSFTFLALRILWMGTIIYATTDKVIVPLLGLPREYSPHFCIGLSVITIIYTAMGGLKAVVITDAVQSLLLLAGAVLTLLVASYYVGGVGAVWNAETPSQWAELDFSLDIGVRATVTLVMISQLTWWICTCGSDQMAVQRYLATRDLATARRMFGISLISSAATIGTLVLVGLALSAYYRTYPDQLQSHSIETTEGANIAFSQFIVHGLPQGITGAVIAGLMAAAMSSLSSGYNSSSLVLAVDFIDRFFGKAKSEHGNLVRTQVLTALVGAATIVVSLLVAQNGKDANLFELVITNSNVFVAPLFLLFFMATFVPWASRLGVCCGFAAATFIAVRLGFYNDFGFGLWHQEHSLTFWMMPVSLLVGIVVGCVTSLIPLSKPCPVLETLPTEAT
jgi:SSS family solute:Na+ symporter